MIRTQVQLTDQQIRALRRMAAERGASVAELVREAVDLIVRSVGQVSSEERRRRALQVVGRFASGLNDISARHDEYLGEIYGAGGRGRGRASGPHAGRRRSPRQR